MATKKTTKKKKVPVAGVAAGVAAAAAAAGAAYYFYGAKNAKSHRRKAAKWATDMRRDVVREAKKLQKVDDVIMHKIVDRVAGTYKGVTSVDPTELRAAAKELKDNWKFIQKEIGDASRAAKSGTKGAVRHAKKAVTKKKKTAKKR